MRNTFSIGVGGTGICHDQLHHDSLDKKAPPKKKLISLCGRCSIMTSEYKAPYIRVGGYTVTHLLTVLFMSRRTIAQFKNSLNDIRKRATQSRWWTAGIVRQQEGASTSHFLTSSEGAHTSTVLISHILVYNLCWVTVIHAITTTHSYMQYIERRKTPLFGIRSVLSIGVIS